MIRLTDEVQNAVPIDELYNWLLKGVYPEKKNLILFNQWANQKARDFPNPHRRITAHI